MRWKFNARVDRVGLREPAQEDVVHDGVVLLLERRVRDARHHRELLVRVRQLLEELRQVVEARDAVPLPAHDDGRHRDLLRIADRQVRAHVDIGAGRHRIVELEDGIGERLDHVVVGGAGMIAVEDRMHEGAVDRPPVLGRGIRRAACCARRASASLRRSTHGRRARAASPSRDGVAQTTRRAARPTRCRRPGAASLPRSFWI